MTYKISVNVLQAVQDFYPGLSDDDAELIASDIRKQWDYSEIYNEIQDNITWYANSHDIDLEGKDGVTEAENNIYVLDSPKSELFKESDV